MKLSEVGKEGACEKAKMLKSKETPKKGNGNGRGGTANVRYYGKNRTGGKSSM